MKDNFEPCASCGKPAYNSNAWLITPQFCECNNIPYMAGRLCLNCHADLQLSGQWTGKAWRWLARQQAAQAVSDAN